VHDGGAAGEAAEDAVLALARLEVAADVAGDEEDRGGDVGSDVALVEEEGKSQQSDSLPGRFGSSSALA